MGASTSVGFARECPPVVDADVLVIGGGPSGIAAAVAAGRSGARVALVERYGFLGGMATAGLVTVFMPWTAGDRPIVRGLFAELRERMSRRLSGVRGGVFDPEAFVLCALDMCEESGVRVLLHGMAAAAEREGDRVAGVVLATKGGLRAARGSVVVDCTGDADVTALAGFATELGRPEDGLMQPVTLCFHVAGVDPDAIPSTAEMTAAYREARDRGEVDCPREDVLMFPTVDPDRFMFNTTRVTGINGSDSLDLTRAEIIGRRQAERIFEVLRKRFAAFRPAYLVRMATQVGVRETRRIAGEYTLTEDDVLSCARFPDAIACCSYSVDIHNPGGEGTTLIPIRGDYYEIPYRCMLPRGAANLLVAGRPISSDHAAHSSLRIMPTCIALGEAAGVAAAMAAVRGVSPAEVAADDLRAELARRGAFVGDGAGAKAEG